MSGALNPPSNQNQPSAAMPVYIAGILTSLDAATIVTGGTAVSALTAGHAAKGGYLTTTNPAGFYVNQLTTATTTAGGSNLFIPQNVIYNILPSPAFAVSVNSTASGVVLSGYGLA